MCVGGEAGGAGRYLWVGFLLLDLAALPNRDLIRTDRVVVNGVGGDTVPPQPTHP